jgi:hypothetical protein
VFQIPPLNLSGGTAASDGKNGSSQATPVQVSMPWNQTKQFMNHSSGSQDSKTSANPSLDGGSASASNGFDLKWILLGAGAWLLLR